jgi:hypothetical protein
VIEELDIQGKSGALHRRMAPHKWRGSRKSKQETTVATNRFLSRAVLGLSLLSAAMIVITGGS